MNKELFETIKKECISLGVCRACNDLINQIADSKTLTIAAKRELSDMMDKEIKKYEA